MRVLLFALLLPLACSDKDKGATPAEGEGEGEGEGELVSVCARASGEGEVGVADANHDGQVDVADGVWTLRWVLNGGAAPACEDAVDLLRDDLVDIGDGLAVFYYLYTGQVELPSSSRMDCESPTAIAEAPCGRLLMGLSGASKLSGPAGEALSATVGVELTSPDLDVQGWSFGVKAEGCTITGSSEDGTAIADLRLDAEGRRDDGFTRVDVVADGLTHGAVLSWKKDAVLGARDEPWRLLNLSVSATPPASGCSECTLKLSNTLAGAGLEVNLVVSAGGRSYTPEKDNLSFQVCAD